MKIIFVIFTTSLLTSVIAIPATFHCPLKIIGGENATRGEFPYQISYQYGIRNIWIHVCGGSILTEEWILTAGHCVTEVPNFGHHRIVAGILNLNDTDKQVIEVIGKYVHPDFPGGVASNDVALLRLKNPLKFNKNVQTVSLPQPNSDPTGSAIVTGWGAVRQFIHIIDIMPNTLQKSTVPLIKQPECKTNLDKFFYKKINPFNTTSMICTGPLTGGHSFCNRDSGGPLVQNGKVIGIISWSIKPCGTIGAPAVYTKVSEFTQWIQSHIH